jgi:hypothetical protein
MLNKVDKRRCEICDIPCFERNNYFTGKRMTTRDFQDEYITIDQTCQFQILAAQ